VPAKKHSRATNRHGARPGNAPARRTVNRTGPGVSTSTRSTCGVRVTSFASVRVMRVAAGSSNSRPFWVTRNKGCPARRPTRKTAAPVSMAVSCPSDWTRPAPAGGAAPAPSGRKCQVCSPAGKASVTKSNNTQRAPPSGQRAKVSVWTGTATPAALASTQSAGSLTTPRGRGRPTVSGWADGVPGLSMVSGRRQAVGSVTRSDMSGLLSRQLG
jgi:hypothetical protein